MKRFWTAIALIAAILWSLGPFLWQVVTSVKPDNELALLPPLLPSAPTLDHYRIVVNGTPFLRFMANSMVVAFCSTLLSVAIGAPAAFGLAKLRVRWKGLILLFILSASMFPPIATVSPLYLIMTALRLRDTLPALIITYTSLSLPLCVWIVTNFFRRVPDEILFAARVDGCSPLQAFWHIMLPVAAPGIFTAALLVFIFSWNEFLFALTFTATPASRTIPVAIALFPGVHEVPWGEIAAASILATLPLILLVVVFQRRIVEGLTAGAVKG
ncbi:MAG: sugar ABC transporter permease [Nitrospirae bacterium GWD2_57_9]|nr:MAG: sugar ABC transporter permease [Nitrospirae bacterium GWD2_57_9]OGW45916.1 MAG: sugar ABC transporter permease [Nitrospirae bacterium GWC2_57_9]